MTTVDLLAQLTWPVEKTEENISSNALLHLPFLQSAHTSYKRAILQHRSGKILRTAVRVALPAMATPREDRGVMEMNIIKIMLYFMRNVAMIGKPSIAAVHEADLEISRSATIEAFHQQDIFSVLLTIGSGLGDEFDIHDAEVMDVVYQLIKGVEVDKLFMEKDELVSASTKELHDLVEKEKALLSGYARHAPSRHNRFTPMMWIKRSGEKNTALLGQAAFANASSTMQEIDKKKKWKKPRRPAKKEVDFSPEQVNDSVPLTAKARRHLRQFVEQFLDSSFNPLFFSVRKAIEREANRILAQHTKQYFYLISWFLRAESARRRKAAADAAATKSDTAVESFGLVAAVLNQETFVLLNRCMQSAQDEKNWREMTACMRCFSQILCTVQEMLDSPLDEDQEIADNILSRIFYEQSTHDRITGLLRGYVDQDFAYLDAVTELSHVFLRLLERYSKQNVDMQIRRIRRVRKKTTQQAGADAEQQPQQEPEINDNDVQQAEKVSSERKFEFTRFAARFVNQNSVNTFVAFLRFYKDLNDEQLKRAHRFFHHVAFKLELSVYVMRLDIVSLMNSMIKGPETLNMTTKIGKDWEELVRQVFKLMIKKLDKTPALAIELLFSKIGATMFYLEHGFDREIQKKTYRAPAELDFKPDTDRPRQFGVIVSILLSQGKSHLLAWVKMLLQSAAEEREAWTDASDAHVAETTSVGQTDEQTQQGPLQGDDSQRNAQSDPEVINIPVGEKDLPPVIPVTIQQDDVRVAASRDKHFRLLFTLLGFVKTDVEDNGHEEESSRWSIPSAVTAEQMREATSLISRYEFEQPTFEDGKTAEDFLRKKTTSIKPQVALDTGADGMSDETGDDLSDLEARLAEGGPAIRANDWEDTRKPKRRRLRKDNDSVELSDVVLAERRAARRHKELEKARKIKSDLYVSVSDDESDEERDKQFFEAEALRREKTRRGHAAAMDEAARGSKAKKAGKGKKRKTVEADDVEDDENIHGALQQTDDVDMRDEESSASASDLSDDEIDEETPPSSLRPSSRHSATSQRQESIENSDKENQPAAQARAVSGKAADRRSHRATLIVDSDSDE